MNPRYPVYIISKGRWKRRQTVKTLERIGVPYKIVVEPQEYDDYASVIDPNNILVLPFSNLGQGSIPARNWVWEHSISIGAEKHWILDDNIEGLFRFNNNRKIRCLTGTPFYIIEDFTNRYENVAISGMQYAKFYPSEDSRPAFYLNTRVYSCLLIRNDLPYRWRGIYNEDTDLSLRVLKDNWCTILFNSFLIDKRTTMVQSGGNSDLLYKEDGRLKMAESLVEQHPDVAKITWKFNRWQHHVDYSKFKKTKLILKDNINIENRPNEYGLKLISVEG